MVARLNIENLDGQWEKSRFSGRCRLMFQLRQESQIALIQSLSYILDETHLHCGGRVDLLSLATQV